MDRESHYKINQTEVSMDAYTNLVYAILKPSTVTTQVSPLTVIVCPPSVLCGTPSKAK